MMNRAAVSGNSVSDKVPRPGAEYESSALPSEPEHAGRLQKWLAAGNSPVTLTLRRAAAIAALEPHYFSGAFHRWYGEPFIVWRRRQRVARAIEGLKARQSSILEVAIASGYKDRRSLERAIKAMTGYTVGELACRLRSFPESVQSP